MTKEKNDVLFRIGYPIATLIAVAIPIIYMIAATTPTSYKPELRPSPYKDSVIIAYNDKHLVRNFLDRKPYGNLDEVVLRTEDGNIVTLQPTDPGFEEQREVYYKDIVPYLRRLKFIP